MAAVAARALERIAGEGSLDTDGLLDRFASEMDLDGDPETARAVALTWPGRPQEVALTWLAINGLIGRAMASDRP